MHDTLRQSDGSHDVEKSRYDGDGLEQVDTHSPPNETNKRAQLDYTKTGSRIVHEKMNARLFLTLTCMSFLWVGSQIPLFLFGSVLPLIYQDIGGSDRWVWFVIAYLIPNAALCPFVGALSDLFGRQKVAIVGQVCLIIGPIITATANSMNIAIAGSVFSGLGAGLNELIALAGTGEVVPVRDRAKYVGLVVLTILPFCPSVLYAQLIAQASSWRYNGILIGVWNFIGLLLVIFCYRDPSRLTEDYTARHVLAEVDYIGGLLSIIGITCFMMGLQWGASQYEWGSVHNIVPLIIGIVFIAAFFLWEMKFAPHPMVPRALFSKAKKTMVIILLITFLSGGNFFVLLLLWPTEIYNVYGEDPLGVGLRGLPIGFGIVIGAFICLVLIPVTKGRIRILLIFFTAVMTAFTGAIAAANPHNLPTMYAIVTIASLGCGAVIIPCSIIAQIACPGELIATVTAITLSLRYVGGAIAFAVYLNLFYSKVTEHLTNDLAYPILAYGGVINPLTAAGQELVKTMTQLMGDAKFAQVQDILANGPATLILDRTAYPQILAASQKAFAESYSLVYYVSIAFGGLSFFLSFFIGDIGPLLTAQIAADAAS